MKDLWRRIARAGVSAIGVWILAGATIAVGEECRNRGQLDTLYCDDDNDLVADVPSDPKKLSEVAGDTLIVDLDQEGFLEAAAAWKQQTHGQLTGFVSHVHTETVARARSAG